jgi:hypothetical protein
MLKKISSPVVIAIAIVSVIGNVFAYFRYSSSRPLITVNGTSITRKEFQDRVDYLYSKPLLSSMVWQLIVSEAAEKQGCVPSSADVDQAVDQLGRSNPSVVEAARKSDPNLLIFREDLASNLALRNLRMVGVNVTAQEVADYYAKHKMEFQLPQQTQTTLVVATNVEDANTASRLLQNGVSNDIIAQQSGLHVVGMNATLTQPLPASFGEEVLNMKSGEVRIIPLGNDFGIVKARTVSNQIIPPLSAIKDQVKTACILSKSPSEIEVLTKLRSAAIITADSSKYAWCIPNDPSEAADSSVGISNPNGQ